MCLCIAFRVWDSRGIVFSCVWRQFSNWAGFQQPPKQIQASHAQHPNQTADMLARITDSIWKHVGVLQVYVNTFVRPF